MFREISDLHGSGAHVGEDFLSGSGILIITKNSVETLLLVVKVEMTICSLIIELWI